MVIKLIRRAMGASPPQSAPPPSQICVTLDFGDPADFAALRPRPIRTQSRMRPGRALTQDMRGEEPSMIDVTPILDRVIAPWEMRRR